MATTPPVLQTKITSDPVKVPMMPVLMAVVAGVVVATSAVGGVLFYVLRSGKIPIHATVTPPAPAPAIQAKTHMVVLEPLLVNLADASGSSYLRAGLTLQVADPAEENEKKTKAEETKPSDKDANAAVRDTALNVLSRETSEQLLSPDGKEQLKKQLRSALAEHNPDVKVVDLFFTEFLVQR